MMFSISVDDSAVRKDIENLKISVPKAAQAAGRSATRLLGEKLRDYIKSKIPDKGGWYDLYKESIQFRELGPDQFEVVTTITEVKFGRLQALKHLMWITGGEDEAAALIAKYNPWSLDTLPTVKDGITCDLVVRPASEAEIEHYRKIRLKDRKELDKLLERLGRRAAPIDAELPVINGRILADVPFLALRLEYGLGGFPRTPIWAAVDHEAQTIAKSSQVQKLGNSVFASRWFGSK